MLNLFGEEIGLRSDQNTITLGLSYSNNKKYQESITVILDSLNAENIVIQNSFQGGSYHLWHGAYTNINELIQLTMEQQKGSLDLGKQLERLSPNDPIIAKKHLIQKGSFRSIELRYSSIDDLGNEPDTEYDAVIYALLCKSTYQKERIEILLQNHVFKNNEKVIVLMMNPKTEEYIRQFHRIELH